MTRNLNLIAVASFFLSASIFGGETAIMDFLRANAPEAHREMKSLKTAAPADFKYELALAEETMVEFQRVEKFNPKGAAAYLKMYRIDFEAIGYSDEIAAGKLVAENRKLLTTEIGKSFDQWVIYERAKLDHLESELARARKKFESEANEKSNIVTSDVDALIEQSRVHLQKSRK